MVGLLAGPGLVFFQVSLFIARFIVPPEDYMFQSPGLIFSTLGSGGWRRSRRCSALWDWA